MNRQVQDGWGQFLARFPWDWYFTLTFRELVSPQQAVRIFRRFARDIEEAADMPIGWFRVSEYGTRGGRLHMHGLMLNVAHLSRLWWMDEWNRRAGYARILPYDASKGAAYYCGKYLTKQGGEWDLSDNLRAFRQYQPVLPLRAGKGLA
jgi:hypothetical protein